MKSTPPSHSPVDIIGSGGSANIRRRKSELFGIRLTRRRMVLSPEEAARAIRGGEVIGPSEVSGRLDLTNLEAECLPAGLHCYELDASGSQLSSLPSDIRIDGRLVLNDCAALRWLPNALRAGSISLRNCPLLVQLPENLDTWFLDLTGCHQFENWPKRGRIQHGSLILRNCSSLRFLPTWLGILAQLDLAGCVQLQEIPEGITVSSWVDIGGSRISGLPPSLQGTPLRWRGVRVNERIAFHPEELSAKEALAEKNAELRRVMIERMGYLRFAQE